MKKFTLHSKIMKVGRTLLLLCSFMVLGCEGFLSEESEIAMGLKSALEVGSEYALQTLGKEDGFFLDQAVKIMLPQDVAKIIQQISVIPGIGNGIKAIEAELILAVNRAAEVAITEVIPIVGKSITEMTIQDASKILYSSDPVAATNYLREKTYNPLCIACGSVIESALNKKIVFNASAQDVWSKFSDVYNIVAKSGLVDDHIETDLALYTTQKALDGVFKKVGDEEIKIRTDASARINDILQKIFGKLD